MSSVVRRSVFMWKRLHKSNNFKPHNVVNGVFAEATYLAGWLVVWRVGWGYVNSCGRKKTAQHL